MLGLLSLVLGGGNGILPTKGSKIVPFGELRFFFGLISGTFVIMSLILFDFLYGRS